MITRIWLAISVISLMAGIFAGYRLHGDSDPKVIVQEKVVTQTVVQHDVTADRIVYKDRVVTVTKIVKPDGTIEETTRTEDKEKEREHQQSHDKTKETEKHEIVVSSKTLSRYSLGVVYHVRYKALRDHPDLKDWRSYEVMGAYRIINGWWVESGVQPGAPGSPLISLGIRYEW